MSQAKSYIWNQLSSDSPMLLLSRRRVIGEKMMISEITLKRGCTVPIHQHENEQFSCLLSGWLRFSIQTKSGAVETHDVRAGEVMHLPSHVPHGVVAMEETVVLDLFSPPSATTGIDRPSS